MADITIQSTLASALSVYDSRSDADDQKNYFGTLTKMADLPANGTVTFAAPHPTTTLVVFGAQNKPLSRLNAARSQMSFVVSDDDLQAMTQADAWVTFAANNPTSPLVQRLAGLKSRADIDAFFEGQPDYLLVRTATYMMAVTYQAANPPAPGAGPDDVTYSLSKLITMLTGSAYPGKMPDITISKLFFRDDDGIVKVGGTVDVTNMPFHPSIAGVVLDLLELAGPVNVEIVFDTNIGLNLFGTKIIFLYKEVDVPLGGTNKLKIVSPSLSLTINPAFKFVILEIAADFPVTVFGNQLDSKLSMVLDNVEIEVGLDVTPGQALTPLPLLAGVHFDSFGLGMGIVFKPPGYALGVQGKFHIGDDPGLVALDDDTFAIILDLEGDIPNPIYLAFYVPKLNLSQLLSIFSPQTVHVDDFDVEFEDLSFFWCENPLEPFALPDGTMTKGGFGFSGYMVLFGLRCFAAVQIDLNQITGEIVLGPVQLGSVFSLTGGGTAVSMKCDQAGNPITNNTVPKTAKERAAVAAAKSKEIVPAGGPTLTLSTAASPYFNASAAATLFGVTVAAIDATIDNNGFVFHVEHPLAHVTCKLGGDQLGATFSYGPDFKVPLRAGLGLIHLQATIDFGVTIARHGDNLSISASGGFAFMGSTINFGPVTVDINIRALSDIVDACCCYIISEAESLFGTLLADARTWASNVANGVVSEVDSVAATLKNYWNCAVDEAGSILHDIGYDVNTAAAELNSVYDDVGALAIAGALGPFGLAADAMGALLQTLGFSAEDVGQVAHKIFGLDPAGTAQLLKDLSFPASSIATVVSDIFTLSPNTVADVLKTVGFPVQVIADVFHAIGGPFSVVGDALEDALTTVEHALNPNNW